MEKSSFLKYIFILLIVGDIVFSFIQFYNTPMDGDVPGGVVPASDVRPILENPLGIKAIVENQVYPNPNRFFSHWIFFPYFNSVPGLLQKIVSPIDSVYLACAIAKTIIQLGLLYLLASLISKTKNIFKFELLLAVVLITPFFQTNGYRSYMGIIDVSTTYTFFYALPLLFLLLYFSPIINQVQQRGYFQVSFYYLLFTIPLAFLVSLSGPLNPGIALVILFLITAGFLIKNFQSNRTNRYLINLLKSITYISKPYWILFVPIGLLSIYSLVLGAYNSITIHFSTSLIELYSRLPIGLFNQFTQKPGFPILFLILTVNMVVINRKFKSEEGIWILQIMKSIGWFALFYILLLPLGGYRDYRPNVLRYDTILPITISLIFLFGYSTLYLLKSISRKQKKWYIPLIVLVLLIFTNADRPEFDKNDCERQALQEIAESKKDIVPISGDCYLLSWKKINDPKDSELAARLLQLWGITDEKKLFYNK